MISTTTTKSVDSFALCSYCHKIKRCKGPNNICTECINEMKVSASLN